MKKKNQERGGRTNYLGDLSKQLKRGAFLATVQDKVSDPICPGQGIQRTRHSISSSSSPEILVNFIGTEKSPRTAVLRGHNRSKLGASQLKSEITLFLMPFLLEIHTFDTRTSRINPIIIDCIRIIFVTPGSVNGGI